MIKKTKSVIALIVATTMFAGSASAFDPDDLRKLKNTNICTECDLSGADLWDANLRSANLYEANLDGANLKEVDRRYARMSGAKLCNTKMPDGSVIYSGC